MNRKYSQWEEEKDHPQQVLATQEKQNRRSMRSHRRDKADEKTENEGHNAKHNKKAVSYRCGTKREETKERRNDKQTGRD